MTEKKRFIRLSATRIKDTKTGENHICYITLFNEITKICDENEQLKQDINYLKGQLKAYSEVSPEGKWILNNGDVE